MTSYDWHVLYASNRRHSCFLDRRSQRLAIADQSGTTPDSTDEGVLWIDRTTAIHPVIFGDRLYWAVALRSERTARPGATWVDHELARFLRTQGLPFEYAMEFCGLRIAVLL